MDILCSHCNCLGLASALIPGACTACANEIRGVVSSISNINAVKPPGSAVLPSIKKIQIEKDSKGYFGVEYSCQATPSGTKEEIVTFKDIRRFHLDTEAYTRLSGVLQKVRSEQGYPDTIYNHIISIFYFCEYAGSNVLKLVPSNNLRARLEKEEKWDHNRIWGAQICNDNSTEDTIVVNDLYIFHIVKGSMTHDNVPIPFWRMYPHSPWDL